MESQKPELKTVEQIEERVELPNQCLGVNFFDKRCTKMLPKGKHVCDCCQKRMNSGSKLASKMSSGKGYQKKSGLFDV